MPRRVAAVDFGTNTARLLIADLHEDGSFSHCLLQRVITRLGGGFSRETGIARDAWERGRACLQQFSVAIRQHGVTTVRAVATSAVRDAGNGPAFVAAMEQQTGIRLAVIDGITEGRITLAGVRAGLDEDPHQMVLFDVGGGSTEYTLTRDGSPFFVQSLPLGVVRLTEGKADHAAMLDKINRELDLLEQRLQAAGEPMPQAASLLVGTAGTATTLAAISLQMTDYDYRRVNNHRLAYDEVRRIFELLAPLSPVERLAVPGLEQGREDLIVAGCLITLKTMERFGAASMKVSDYGLLEGLVSASADDAGTLL